MATTIEIEILMSEKENASAVKRIYTKLKFIKSDKTGAFVSFVSQNPVTGQIRGVRQDEPYPKKICILDKKLACEVFLNVLYNATLIPMHGKDGYVVIEATPVMFRASIEITYIPKAIYMVEVKFGNKDIVFNPKDGKKDSVKNLRLCRRLLETRLDVENLQDVLEDFDEAAREILKRYERDGFIYAYR